MHRVESSLLPRNTMRRVAPGPTRPRGPSRTVRDTLRKALVTRVAPVPRAPFDRRPCGPIISFFKLQLAAAATVYPPWRAAAFHAKGTNQVIPNVIPAQAGIQLPPRKPLSGGGHAAAIITRHISTTTQKLPAPAPPRCHSPLVTPSHRITDCSLQRPVHPPATPQLFPENPQLAENAIVFICTLCYSGP